MKFFCISKVFLCNFQVLEARSLLKNDPPLLLKIAPDLTEDDKIDIADVVMNDKVSKDWPNVC